MHILQIQSVCYLATRVIVGWNVYYLFLVVCSNSGVILNPVYMLVWIPLLFGLLVFICTGKLLNRTLRLLKKNCQSMLAFDSSIAAEGHPFKDTVEKLVRISNIFLKLSSLLNLFFVI